MVILKCNRLVRRPWDMVLRTRRSGCWRGYTRSSLSGQTPTRGQTKKVRIKALRTYLCIRFGLTLISIDLDVYLLVLACGTSGTTDSPTSPQLTITITCTTCPRFVAQAHVTREFYVPRFAPNCQLTGRSIGLIGLISFQTAFFRPDIGLEILRS
jgi:hypothetical protein